MKALSLWQPWASAIERGAKRIETRGWYTSYRGPLAIHAAKRCVKDELLQVMSTWNWNAALGWHMGGDEPPLWEVLPFGAIIAVADLVDCRPTGSFTVDEIDARRTREERDPIGWDSWTERFMGDFSPGRFGWVLDRVRSLEKPIPWKGMQGLFEVPDNIILEAQA